jgi:hypothetical protein
LYFWFDGFESGYWAIAGPSLDVHRKYRIYTILGEKKKNKYSVLFKKKIKIKNFSSVTLIARG